MWVEFTKNAGQRSSYPVDDIAVVIVSSKIKSRVTGYRLLIMPPVYELLGRPKKIELLYNGAKIGMRPSVSDNAYKIQSINNNIRWVWATAILNEIGASSGVYDCAIIDDMVVFDTSELRF